VGLGYAVTENLEREAVKILLLCFLAMVTCSKEDSKEDKKEVPETTEEAPEEEPAEESPGEEPTEEEPTPVPGGQGDVVEIQKFMIFHNLKRCWHETPRVKWSESLASQAKRDAARCTLAKAEAQDSIAFGESLDQVKAQDNWYLEFLKFPWREPAKYDDAKAGNFARMIWKDTKEIGCAHVKCGKNDVYYCKYSAKADPNNATGKVKYVNQDIKAVLSCNGTN